MADQHNWWSEGYEAYQRVRLKPHKADPGQYAGAAILLHSMLHNGKSSVMTESEMFIARQEYIKGWEDAKRSIG